MDMTTIECDALADEAAVAGDERMERIARKAARLLDQNWADCRDDSAVKTVLAAIRDAEAQR